jgi:hypothetical protein
VGHEVLAFVGSRAGVPLLAGLLYAQGKSVLLPPVPPNPNDPVAAGVQLLSTPAERAAALNLLSLASQNYEFGQQGTPDLAVSVSQLIWNQMVEGTVANLLTIANIRPILLVAEGPSRLECERKVMGSCGVRSWEVFSWRALVR